MTFSSCGGESFSAFLKFTPRARRRAPMHLHTREGRGSVPPAPPQSARWALCGLEASVQSVLGGLATAEHRCFRRNRRPKHRAARNVCGRPACESRAPGAAPSLVRASWRVTGRQHGMDQLGRVAQLARLARLFGISAQPTPLLRSPPAHRVHFWGPFGNTTHVYARAHRIVFASTALCAGHGRTAGPRRGSRDR